MRVWWPHYFLVSSGRLVFSTWETLSLFLRLFKIIFVDCVGCFIAFSRPAFYRTRRNAFLQLMKLRILGQLLKTNGIRLDPDRLRSASEFPTTTSSMDVRRYLRLCTHFQIFICGFSNIMVAFSCVLRNKAKFRSAVTSNSCFMSSSVLVNLGSPMIVLMSLRLRVSKLYIYAFVRRK